VRPPLAVALAETPPPGRPPAPRVVEPLAGAKAMVDAVRLRWQDTTRLLRACRQHRKPLALTHLSPARSRHSAACVIRLCKFESFNRDSQDIPESRRAPGLAGMSMP